MNPPDPVVYHDFVDPLSFLLSRELGALDLPPAATPAWVGVELRPPPSPLVDRHHPDLRPRWSRAEELAQDIGVTLDPPDLVPWTRKAHELMRYAAEHDRADQARRTIFSAYMEQGRDIGRVDVLVEIATGLDLDPTETKAVLDVDRHEADVASARKAALARGIDTVPVVVAGDERLEGFHNGDALRTFLGV